VGKGGGVVDGYARYGHGVERTAYVWSILVASGAKVGNGNRDKATRFMREVPDVFVYV